MPATHSSTRFKESRFKTGVVGPGVVGIPSHIVGQPVPETYLHRVVPGGVDGLDVSHTSKGWIVKLMCQRIGHVGKRLSRDMGLVVGNVANTETGRLPKLILEGEIHLLSGQILGVWIHDVASRRGRSEGKHGRRNRIGQTRELKVGHRE